MGKIQTQFNSHAGEVTNPDKDTDTNKTRPMKYNLIRQVQYLASVCIGNHSQYNYHKRKLNKHVRKYADTIKFMNGRICNSDYNSPWSLYEEFNYDD